MNTPTNFSADVDTAAARFGQRVAASLTERSQALPHDIAERLRFAREQALVRAAAARAAAAATTETAPPVVQVGSTLAFGAPQKHDGGRHDGLWAKLVSVLPLLALLAGLLLMQQGRVHEQLVAAAEVDTALLSDKLPPDAFRDPGFAEYLRDGDASE